jgi:hypothetical protein
MLEHKPFFYDLAQPPSARLRDAVRLITYPAATGSPTACSRPTKPSSTQPARPEASSSHSLKSSPLLEDATGPTSVKPEGRRFYHPLVNPKRSLSTQTRHCALDLESSAGAYKLVRTRAEFHVWGKRCSADCNQRHTAGREEDRSHGCHVRAFLNFEDIYGKKYRNENVH